MQELRLRQSEMDNFMGLAAAVEELEKSQTVMQKRLKMIPNGWRDAKMLYVRLCKLFEDIVTTIPPEKQLYIARTAKNMSYRVFYHGTVSTVDDDVSVIPNKDFQNLCIATHEKCLFCDKDCSQCVLGKTFDHLLRHSRGKGESWSTYDFEGDHPEEA